MSKKLKKTTDAYPRYKAEYSLFLFSLILVPVTWLLLDRGPAENILLLLYLGFVALTALFVLARFVYRYTYLLDQNSIQIGSLIRQSVVRYFFPLAVLKFIAYGLYGIIVMDHAGLPRLICDLLKLLQNLYNWLYPVQQILNWAIIGGIVVLGIAEVWTLIKKAK